MTKRINLLIAILAFAFGYSLAETPLNLVFESTDNSTRTIEAKSLTMSVSGDKLTATNGTETMEMELSKLTKMYFTGGQTGVELMPIDFNGKGIDVYSLDGHFKGNYDSVATALSSLTTGIYIIKSSDNKTIKIAVQ